MDKWSQLPSDMLREIEDSLTLFADKIRVRSICQMWRSTLPQLQTNKLYEFPGLLLPFDDKAKTTTQLYSLIERKVLDLTPRDIKGKLFKGSSHGWVVLLADDSALYLFNPLTKAQIQLPPRSKFPDVVKYRRDRINNEYAFRICYDPKRLFFSDSTYVHNCYTDKIILSADPDANDDYMAVAIYGEFCRLAYCKKGYKKWVCLYKERSCFEDALFFEGKLYALTRRGYLVIFEFGETTKIEKIEPKNPINYSTRLYIVRHSDGIVMIERLYDTLPYGKELKTYKTHTFNIYKLENTSSGGTPSWHSKNSFGGDTLFVGQNTTMAISSPQEFSGIRGNCIYFTDDNLSFHQSRMRGGFDMGVYSLDDRSIEPLPGYKCDNDPNSQPIWLTPKPH